MDAWRRHDTAAVLATLTDDCVITECYGPVYRGRRRVEEWMRAWFGAGRPVDGWRPHQQPRCSASRRRSPVRHAHVAPRPGTGESSTWVSNSLEGTCVRTPGCCRGPWVWPPRWP
ncbi:YybH family protein [Streptomyces chisholmiae]|uniref:YybH family protein n=1 Tax=Streptomyces chisholmiae TaxID=3075540 RepID=UPI00374E18C5